MRKHILTLLAIFAVLAGGVWWWLRQPDVARVDFASLTGQIRVLPDPRPEGFPTINIADAVGWQRGERPVAAGGLAVAPFATGLDHPRWLLRLANGDVLVAESNSPAREGGGVRGWVMRRLMGRAGAGGASADRITLLRDANGDGVAEARSVLIDHLVSPFGMTVMGGYLYIGDTDALLRVPFVPGQTRISARPEKVIDLPGGGNHWARNVLAAPNGKMLYVTVGSATNIADDGLDAEQNRAVILQVEPDRKQYRVFAAGLRNPVGLAWQPRTGGLWTVVNERDMLGSDLVPDYLTQVEFGDHFGWPWYYWGGYPDKRVNQDNPELQEYVKRPDYALGPHVAALGLAFAGDIRLGGRFGSGAFVGEHGSWNRSPASGYKVVFVPFGADGFPVKGAKPVDVLAGFLTGNGKARGRPAGVAADRTGALLVADDVGNTIWRVSAK